MRAKTTERAAARRLRRRGRSVRQIAAELGVSKGSVSQWVRDVTLAPSVKAALDRRNPATNKALRGPGGSLANAVGHRHLREKHQLQGRETARKAEALHRDACLLYWAEGGKCRNRVTISNSDPDLLHRFVSFLHSYFPSDVDAIRLDIAHYPNSGTSREEAAQFWRDKLGLASPAIRWRKADSRTTTSTRKNRHKYGICYVTLCRVHIVQHIYGAIQEYAQINRPEWLD